MDILADLQNWYISNCNGEWEHQHGINIESRDNPGWWVKIDLMTTELLNKPFEPVVR